jgi:hypothetical protein
MGERYLVVEDNYGWTVVDSFLWETIRTQIPTEQAAYKIAEEWNEDGCYFDDD